MKNEEHVTLHLEDDRVRFTPDGQIAILDAIGALSQDDCPVCIWEDLKRDNPHLLDICNVYTFPEKEAVPVADSQGWEVIQTLLLEHMIDSEPD
jgi:hypothetical protein